MHALCLLASVAASLACMAGTLLPLSRVWYLVLGGFLLFGMLIGSLGTASSIRKYLKV